MSVHPEYPSAADAKWSVPLVIAALLCAVFASFSERSGLGVLLAVAAIALVVPTVWWTTRRQRLIKLMGTRPAWEGTAYPARSIFCTAVAVLNNFQNPKVPPYGGSHLPHAH